MDLFALIKKLLILTFLLVGCAMQTYGETIRVSSQKDFDALNEWLNKSLSKGRTKIKVIIKPGNYFYTENHLSFENIQVPRAKISIKGNRAILIPRGTDYIHGETFQGTFTPDISIVDVDNCSDIMYWDDVKYAESRIEPVDTKNNLWRLKCTTLHDASQRDCCNMYVIVTCWFTSITSKVDHIQNGYLYFICGQKMFNKNLDSYFIDTDYAYGNRYARFKLCNYDDSASLLIDSTGKLRMVENSLPIHVCRAGTFFKMKDCCFSTFSFSGLTFLGGSSNKAYLIDCDNISTKSLSIKDCVFNGIKNTIVGLTRSDNFVFENNTVSNSYRSGVLIENGCKKARIVNNKFSNCGLSLNQDYPISVLGEDYYVSSNTIVDYGYAAIRIGVWHGFIERDPSYGIVENNEIYYSSDYNENIDNHGLMDGGAIYLATHNDGAIIRYNYIHDIDGIKDNRGIFCDDGARNISIYGNVVIRIHNCYCIDSRRVSSFEPEIGPTNIGLSIFDNIVDGSFRFEAREGDNNNCYLGNNYFLVKENKQMPRIITKNIESSGKFKQIDCLDNIGDYVLNDRQDYLLLKSCVSSSILKAVLQLR